MIYYSIYSKNEIRENCQCGLCINADGFKNTLSTWHASRLLFTNDTNKVSEFVKRKTDIIIYSARYNEKLRQLEDYKVCNDYN